MSPVASSPVGHRVTCGAPVNHHPKLAARTRMSTSYWPSGGTSRRPSGRRPPPTS